MEPERHPGRKVHGGHRRAGKRGGIEDDEIAGVSRSVVHEAENPALVLTVPVGAPHEHGLSGLAVLARVEPDRLVPCEVVLDQPGRAVGAGQLAQYPKRCWRPATVSSILGNSTIVSSSRVSRTRRAPGSMVQRASTGWLAAMVSPGWVSKADS